MRRLKRNGRFQLDQTFIIHHKLIKKGRSVFTKSGSLLFYQKNGNKQRTEDDMIEMK
jgi:hypothetical protein